MIIVDSPPIPTAPWTPRVTTALPTPVGAPGDLVVDVESAPGSPVAGVRGFMLFRKLKRLGARRGAEVCRQARASAGAPAGHG